MDTTFDGTELHHQPSLYVIHKKQDYLEVVHPWWLHVIECFGIPFGHILQLRSRFNTAMAS